MTMRRCVKLRLSPKKLLLLLRVAAAAIVLCFLLRIINFPRLIKILGLKEHVLQDDDCQIRDIIQAINLLSGTRFFVIRNNCLKKTLLLYYFLRRAGLKGLAINIGINKVAGKLAGHSWLTLNNEIFLDNYDNVSIYEVIYSTKTNNQCDH
ncbi:MAG: hypothetical protein A4E55_00246 [Pelotomaculum sp. PtaU1.Bin035]|nr:MAG: hypothetical protein A4E55_00246 [Pelotomaculum sp. PtaU1.Bin035]